MANSSQRIDIAEYPQAAVYEHAVDHDGGINHVLQIPRSLVPVHPGLPDAPVSTDRVGCCKVGPPLGASWSVDQVTGVLLIVTHVALSGRNLS